MHIGHSVSLGIDEPAAAGAETNSLVSSPGTDVFDEDAPLFNMSVVHLSTADDLLASS